MAERDGRKREMKWALAALMSVVPLPEAQDPAIYGDYMMRLGIATSADMNILISVLRDEIMAAGRKGTSADKLIAFHSWAMHVLLYDWPPGKRKG